MFNLESHKVVRQPGQRQQSSNFKQQESRTLQLIHFRSVRNFDIQVCYPPCTLRTVCAMHFAPLILKTHSSNMSSSRTPPEASLLTETCLHRHRPHSSGSGRTKGKQSFHQGQHLHQCCFALPPKRVTLAQSLHRKALYIQLEAEGR